MCQYLQFYLICPLIEVTGHCITPTMLRIRRAILCLGHVSKKVQSPTASHSGTVSNDHGYCMLPGEEQGILVPCCCWIDCWIMLGFTGPDSPFIKLLLFSQQWAQ